MEAESLISIKDLLLSENRKILECGDLSPPWCSFGNGGGVTTKRRRVGALHTGNDINQSERFRSEVVGDLELVAFERIDHLHRRGWTRPLEPGGGTPAVLAGDGNQFVMHGIVVNIIKSGEVDRKSVV